MNDILSIALETLEHLGRVRAGRQGATQINYFYTSRKSRVITQMKRLRERLET